MKLSDFDFALPQSAIAKYPKNPRGSSKLLHLNHQSKIQDYNFQQITSLFQKGDALVLNNTKVIPAYLEGIIAKHCGDKKEVIVYLSKDLGDGKWLGFIKPGKLAKIGEEIVFQDQLLATLIDKDVNTGEVRFEFNINDAALLTTICNIGKMPIPPYFKRKPELSDKVDYQTIFAKYYGSVAAPTAGLHFNEEILQELKNKGVEITYVTLHVGTGTFLPVKTNNITEHKMHCEKFLISQGTADLINQKKKENRRIICVGTTSLRALEAAANSKGILTPQISETDIFITPGYKFKVADALITNFHMPKSTLFMLVCAFSGIDSVKNAYAYAIKHNYRFFSYGDACWLDRLDA
ncbi:tRNA preQ1(34) S-adenosylmethionine ribosyltransferase-isomerase QueA [Candidatus Bandiella euplotis]|uniref:S-adenosylmethionine:tRNA ribosyltransferase-isomerase n=1 Tax=Candidatus Bandiella euplotis TaxID=1664265 RepID=A0ABZ0UQ25_9RICK|nr:tRNA preQ1(34) S-adenosylmethionine ribosyltransferase-isomerase QueA [Candidatus Bandiella woodruffii]WPX97124.1 S-adenosylmethionine:tRNA ribosyltransferase-isomerase [Candidatus Bandiella woodruffii]